MVLRLILFITFTAIQFLIPFSVMRWCFGLDDFLSLALAWAWSVVCIAIITSPEKGDPK